VSIVINKLGDEQGRATHAQIRHGNREFSALVHGSRASLEHILNQECIVELGIERVVSWREFTSFKDSHSCIEPSEQVLGAFIIRGRVHSAIEVDEYVRFIDLYLQTGPEFLTISSQELGGVIPSTGTGLEVIVCGLCFYPTGTSS